MNDDKLVPQNDPVAPYRQMYYMLEQLRDENAAHIRERQELQDITANEAEPLINRTVIHLQEVFSLLEETAMNRHAMIHAELRQALSGHLELSPHVADFFKLNHEFALNPSCGPEETISATYVTSDGDFIVTAIASFQKRATLTIQHVHKFLPPEDGSHS